MYCKPGKVRPMVEKFKKVAAMGSSFGFGQKGWIADQVVRKRDHVFECGLHR